MSDIAQVMMFCAMSCSLSLVAANGSGSPGFRGSVVQVLDRAGRQTRGGGSTATSTGAQVLAEFVLMDDPVIRLISASDRVLRLVAGIIEPDDLIAAFPDLGLTILRVGDGLSHGKSVTPCGARGCALFWLLLHHERRWARLFAGGLRWNTAG
jgi:hypothetical protein